MANYIQATSLFSNFDLLMKSSLLCFSMDLFRDSCDKILYIEMVILDFEDVVKRVRSSYAFSDKSQNFV